MPWIEKTKAKVPVSAEIASCSGPQVHLFPKQPAAKSNKDVGDKEPGKAMDETDTSSPKENCAASIVSTTG